METGIQEQKMAKAYTILSKGDRPTQIDQETFTLPSQSGNWYYTVKCYGQDWVCDCPDHNKREADCKHIYTVKFWLNLRDNLKDRGEYSKALNFQPCPKCDGYDIIKHAYRKTKQGVKTRLKCKDCGATFTLKDDGFNDMKFDSEIVTLALDLYFKGVSLRKVSHHIQQFRGVTIDHTTIYKWIKKYSEIIKAYVDTLEPELGDMWSADEMMIRLKYEGRTVNKTSNAKYVWHWNCMDTKTRYLISNLVTKKRGVKEARELFKEAKDIGGKKPEYVVTDGLGVYHRAFKKVFRDLHQRSKHISEVGIKDRINNNRVERLHGTIRDRDKVMRAMGSVKSSQKILDGHRVYYNFVRPHMALDGKTPAEEAGLDLGLGNDKWLGLIEKAVEYQTKNSI